LLGVKPFVSFTLMWHQFAAGRGSAWETQLGQGVGRP
jgi:hypothetical protein